ncbi:MAG: aminoacyl-tRNA hydrolase [Oceanococcaceae bacterium]
MSTQRVLIVGLGNPGSKYAQTRHNAGFWLVDALAGEQRVSLRNQSRMQAETAEATLVDGARVLLAKPQTFMNNSGQSVRALIDFYKLPLDALLVAHDELDLPPGRVRLKQGGGPGGHNGLKDIIRHCGADFRRLRIGVGHPGQREAVLGHVLSAAGRDEQISLDRAVEHAATAVMNWLTRGWEPAVQIVHSAT